MYLILLVLGLLIGAGFLVVLLVGDRKEARLEAQRKAYIIYSCFPRLAFGWVLLAAALAAAMVWGAVCFGGKDVSNEADNA